MQKKILLVGESWTSTSTHVKGFDQFATATWHTGATDFLAALAESPYAITYLPAHAAATDFPLTWKRCRSGMRLFSRTLAPIRCCCIRTPG